MAEITWGTVTAALVAPVILLLPGWAVLSLFIPPESFAPDRRPDGASWLILGVGLTLALTPVGLLWLYLAGIKIGPGLVAAYLGISAVVIAWRRGPHWWSRLSRQRRRPWRERLQWLDAPLVALILSLALTVAVRLWVVRGLNAGPWGDSYQHTMITQLILDNGGLFQSWQPYAPLTSLTYHFGLHGNVALFQWAGQWLTALTTPRSLILFAQLLNALAALTVYPLTVRMSGGNRWAGVGAVLLAGLLSQMPMFYVNWGRFTQLAGQVILPVGLWFLVEALDRPAIRPRRWILAGIALAGLGLTHYRIIFFVPCFLLPYLLWRLWVRRRDWRGIGQLVAGLAVTGAVSLLLVAPWLWMVLQGAYASTAADVVADPNAGSTLNQAYLYERFWQWLSWPLALLAALGAGLALWRRSAMNLVTTWLAMLFLLANPHWVGLPGTGLVDNFTVLIALYLPASMLGGYVLGEAIRYGGYRWRLLPWVVVVLVVAAGMLGARARASTLLPGFQMVTPADEQAMAWIRTNTGAGARFLINGFLAFDENYAAGTDAGWWIPLLAGRQNTIPPLNYAGEAGADPDYVTDIKTLVQYVEDTPLDDAATAAWLQDQGITHVYIGAKDGRIGDPDEPLLDAGVLQQSPYYRLVYHKGGVSIFEVTAEGGPVD